jgi:hypothetical protein
MGTFVSAVKALVLVQEMAHSGLGCLAGMIKYLLSVSEGHRLLNCI